MKKALLTLTYFIFVSLVLVGCSKSPTEPAPQPTNTPIPAATATPATSNTPVLTATPGASGTPVATATPLPSGNCRYEVITEPIGAGAFLTQSDNIGYHHDNDIQTDLWSQSFPWQLTTNVTLGSQAVLSLSFVTSNFTTNHPEINNTRFTLNIYRNGVLVKGQSFTLTDFIYNTAVINIYFD